MMVNCEIKKKILSKYFVVSILFVIFLSAPSAVFAEEQDSIATLRKMGKAFASIAEKASPAVVGVKAQRTVSQSRSPYGDYYFDPFGEDLFDYFFRRSPRQRRQERQYQQPRTAQGSGFIISAEGYILTNNHVVEEAEEVEVELTDGRKYSAIITGSDPESDVAVLKIDAKDLKYLELADSNKLEVGEWVLAIGNPLGLSHTVTAGIVSAKGRNRLGLATLEDFIQTDAAINFGNSGGPLINLDGKVVGINSAIAGSTGNIGIGFAIPVNMAKYAYQQIIESGKVERGLLGVSNIEDLTPENASFFGLADDTRGVLIPNVIEDSAADKAGLTHNDVILEVDGKPVESALDLQTRISMLKPGTKIELTIWRDGRRKNIELELGKRSAVDQLTGGMQSETAEELGFTVETLTDELKERYGYDNQKGVIVKSVNPASQAARSGISAGTLIKEVNRQPVRNTKDFYQAVERAKKQGRILLLVNIEGTNYFVILNVK